MAYVPSRLSDFTSGLSNLSPRTGSSMDPMTIAAIIQGATSLGGALLGGGDPEPQGRGFSDPKQNDTYLRGILGLILKELQGQQANRSNGATRLRSSYVQAPPPPMSIPGLPFSIGAGAGRDPALGDPSLLAPVPFAGAPAQTGTATGPAQPRNPMDYLSQAGVGPGASSSGRTVTRRAPSGIGTFRR